MARQPLKPEDIALFRQHMKGVKPLDTDIVESPRPVRPRRKSAAARHAEIHAGKQAWTSVYSMAAAESSDTDGEDFIEFRREGVQDRLFRKLRRGRIPVSFELDLHGMTANQAGNALDQFMEKLGKPRRQQCVRIIHGKGYGSRNRQPVIKRLTQSWLQCNINVLAYSSCRPEDGGTGALYVLVKNSE